MTREELRSGYLDGFARLLTSWLVSAEQKHGVRALQLVIARDDAVMDQLFAVYQTQRKENDMDRGTLDSLNIPQDIVDKAQQLEVSAVELFKLCVEHSVEAARSWLTLLASKLPKLKGGG